MNLTRWGVRTVCSSLLTVALVIALVVLGPAPRAHAGTIQAGPTQVTNPDPTSITFSARVQSSAGLKSAELQYKVLNPDGNVGGTGDATLSPGTETDVSFTLTTKDATRYIPVGSRFSYHWILTDNDGQVVNTPEETHVFLDGRYQWQHRTEGQVTVYWYGADDTNATIALQAAKASLADTQKLLDVTVPYPIRLIVWRSEAEGQLAMQSRGTTFDSQVITGGERVAPDLIFVFTPDVAVIRHETAHVVTHVAGDGPFTSLPSWIDEGTAVYEQPAPGSAYTTGLQMAIATNHTLRLKTLQAPVNQPDLVNQFYGQSWSTVKFIIDKYGQQKFAEIFKLVKAGSRIDDALRQAIGVDQDGLYNEWRQANGLQPEAFATAVASTAVAAAEATRPPLSIPTSTGGSSAQATPVAGQGQASTGAAAATAVATVASGAASATGASGSKTGAAVAVGLVTLVLAAGLGGAGFMLLRRRG